MAKLLVLPALLAGTEAMLLPHSHEVQEVICIAHLACVYGST